MKSKVKLGNDFAPIVTIGYDTSFSNPGPLTFNIEAGLMYSGAPRIDVTSNGKDVDRERLEADLKANIKKSISPNKNLIKFYPVLSFGMRYYF